MPAKKQKVVNAIPDSNIVIDCWKCIQTQDKFIRFMTYLNMDSEESIKNIERSCYTIYTSEFNKWYLQTYCEVAESRLIPLREEETTDIYDPDLKTEFRVTAFSANYYAGSLMYLFQGPFGNVLYTGFFRLSSKTNVFDVPVLKNLIDKKELDVCYIDNTYAAEHCIFPPKATVIDQIIDCIRKNPKHKIAISGRRFGKEEVLVDIAKTLEEPIYVNERKYALLCHIGVNQYFTTDKNKTRIYSYDYTISAKECIKWQSLGGPRVIVLLTAYYECSQMQCCLDKVNVPGLHIFAYSSHSSHPELMHFVSTVTPHVLKPILDENKSTNTVIPDCMNQLCHKTADDVELFFETCSSFTDAEQFSQYLSETQTSNTDAELLEQLAFQLDKGSVFPDNIAHNTSTEANGTVEGFLKSVTDDVEYRNVEDMSLDLNAPVESPSCQTMMECDLYPLPTEIPSSFNMLVVNTSSNTFNSSLENTLAPLENSSSLLNINEMQNQFVSGYASTRNDEFIRHVQNAVTSNSFVSDQNPMNNLNLVTVSAPAMSTEAYSMKLKNILQACAMQPNDSTKYLSSVCERVTSVEGVPSSQYKDNEEESLASLIFSTCSKYFSNKQKIVEHEMMQKTVYASSSKSAENGFQESNRVHYQSNVSGTRVLSTSRVHDLSVADDSVTPQPEIPSVVPVTRSTANEAQLSMEDKIVSYINSNPLALFNTDEYYERLRKMTLNKKATNETVSATQDEALCTGTDNEGCKNRKEMEVSIKRNQNISKVLHQYSALSMAHRIDSNELLKSLNGCDLFSHSIYRDTN